MIMTIGTRPNTNGNIYRVIIDTDKKTYKAGYIGTYSDIHATRKEIDQLIKFNLKIDGYTEA